MKIFFLDIDGVFTSHRANVGHLNIGGKMTHFDQYAVSMINTLGKAANAQCVIISSKRYTDPTLLVDLKRQGLKVPLHEDWCMPRHPNPKIDEADRGYLIRQWCKQHGVSTDNIVIFDDDNCGYDKELAKRFVQSDMFDGFGFKHFEKARNLLSLSMADCRIVQNQLLKERSANGRYL